MGKGRVSLSCAGDTALDFVYSPFIVSVTCSHMMKNIMIMLFRGIETVIFLKKLDRAYSYLKQQC